MSESRRIALFTKSLTGGGAERVMIHLASALSDLGYAADLVLCEPVGPLVTLVPDHVRVVDLGARRVRCCVPALVRYLRRERPAGMITALEHTNIAAVVARELAHVDVRLLLTTHSVLSAHLALRSPVERFVLRRLLRFSFRRADCLAGVSQAVVDDLVQCFGQDRERVVRIPNPVVTGELLRRAREPIDHPWFTPDSPPVVLGVGRLSRVKRWDVLLEAFMILRRHHQARLLILGEGEERARLERRAAELGLEAGYVALPGYVENPFAYMARASVLALSSDHEGLPNVLIEALATGCPVVSTDCPGGSREILGDGRFGRLVPCRDPDALATALGDALRSPPDAETLRRRGGEYSAEASVKLYLAHLRLGHVETDARPC